MPNPVFLSVSPFILSVSPVILSVSPVILSGAKDPSRRIARRVSLLVATVLLALANPSSVFAESPQPPSTDGYFLRDYAEISAQPALQPWWSLTLDLVVKLGLVIGLIYLTMWALKRFVIGPQARARMGGSEGKLRVLDSTALAPNRSVYLLEVADRVLVLGATPGTLATLAEITDPAAIAALKAQPTEEPASFADQFRGLTGALPVVAAPSFLQDKIGELRAATAHFRRSSEDA